MKQRAPKLSELKERVREIKNASESLLKLCGADPVDTIGKQKSKQKPISRGIASRVLSTSQIVNQYLIDALPTRDRSLKEYLEPVSTLAEVAEQGLQQLEKRASKRGKKTDVGLEYLVIVLVFVACRVTKRTDFELPSPNTRTYQVANYPLLQFVRSSVAIGAEKGLRAVTSSTKMTPDEIKEATNRLSAATDPKQRRGTVDWIRKRQLFERKRHA